MKIGIMHLTMNAIIIGIVLAAECPESIKFGTYTDGRCTRDEKVRILKAEDFKDMSICTTFNERSMGRDDFTSVIYSCKESGLLTEVWTDDRCEGKPYLERNFEYGKCVHYVGRDENAGGKSDGGRLWVKLDRVL